MISYGRIRIRKGLFQRCPRPPPNTGRAGGEGEGAGLCPQAICSTLDSKSWVGEGGGGESTQLFITLNVNEPQLFIPEHLHILT